MGFLPGFYRTVWDSFGREEDMGVDYCTLYYGRKRLRAWSADVVLQI